MRDLHIISHHELDPIRDTVNLGVMPGALDLHWIDVYRDHWKIKTSMGVLQVPANCYFLSRNMIFFMSKCIESN